MSPETRRYTESVMNLTFEQLAAGAAGQPSAEVEGEACLPPPVANACLVARHQAPAA